MALKNWDKLKHQKRQPNTEMWGNNKKGGMVFVSKLDYPSGNSKWRFGGVNGRGYFKETHFATKPRALSFANNYMRRN
jgi:hypothetical protein